RAYAHLCASGAWIVSGYFLGISPGIYFARVGRSGRLCARLLLVARAQHRHQPLLDRGGGLGWLETERESFVQAVALINEVLGGRAVLFARCLKRLQFFRFLRP